MNYFRNVFSKLRWEREEGATAVEYGVMVALIAAVIVAIVLLLGRQVKSGFCDTSEALAEGGVEADSPLDAECAS